MSYRVEKVQGTETVSSVLAENPFKHSSPGIMVQFAVFSLVTTAGIIVDERKSGTLQRLVTTSMSRAEIISGHVIAMFAIETVGEGFAAAAHFTPTFYVITGLENILVREMGLASVILPVCIVFGFAGLFFAAALWRFSKTEQK